MKTICGLILVCGLAAGAQQPQQPSQQQQPSLGDIARQYRAQKKPGPPAHVLDNDAFAAVNSSATATATSAETNKAPDDKKTDIKSGDAKDLAKVTPNEQQKWDTWKTKLETQKREVALLQREADVVEREARVRAANYYADAGAQLRDPGKYAEDTRKQQEELQAKTLLLNAAKQRLADLQEQARKDGVPNSVIDN